MRRIHLGVSLALMCMLASVPVLADVFGDGGGGFSRGLADTLYLKLTGGVVTGATEFQSALSNTSANNNGQIYFQDNTEVNTASTTISSCIHLTNTQGYAGRAFFCLTGTAASSTEGNNSMVLGNAAGGNIMANQVFEPRAGLANLLTSFQDGDLYVDDIFKMKSATYAAADCNAAAEVGRIVMHNNAANKITACICVQTGAATYAFTAIPVAAGVCP